MTHFLAVLIFAFFTAIVFGITQREKPAEMVRFGAITFASLVGVTIAASWVMYFIKP
jgi:uncharacterized membrane protein